MKKRLIYAITVIIIAIISMFLTLKIVEIGEANSKINTTDYLTITKIDNTSNAFKILVESTNYKAYVSIDGFTVIIDENKKTYGKEFLKEGMKVKVQFIGPVMESFPVQGSAKKIYIFNKSIE